MQSIIEYPEYSSLEGEKNIDLPSFAISFDLHEEKGELQQRQQAMYSRSPAIPLPESHIHRTESELDLTENIAMAEFRDQCMFNRLVSGIQKQQKLLYDVENHCPHPQQKSSSSSSSSACNEEKEDSWGQYKYDRQNRGLHSSLPSDSTADRDCRREAEIFESRSSDSYLPFPCPYSSKSSTPEECMEENQRSIENIICTRHSRVALNNTSGGNSRMVDATMAPILTSTASYAAITDDEGDNENSDDFGQVFDLELY